MSLSLKSMDVITAFTEDLAGTRSFYEEVLGLPVLGEHENEHGPPSCSSSGT
ncbi:MAG: VOC family protein [Streptosporangiaceae bacterium]